MLSQFTQDLTLVDLLRDRAQGQPHKTAYTFLKDGETLAHSITYHELDHRARAIAAYLNATLSPGDHALLVYPYDAGIEFITAFLGCLYAGMIAVPSHAPRNRYAFSDLSGRLVSSGARAVLTPSALQAKLRQQFSNADNASSFKDVHWIVADAIPDEAASNWVAPNVDMDAVAFLQYTSGSTGTPKGVMITHRSLLHNQRLLQMAFGHTDASIGVGWLPMFHDMGLIGNVLQALYLGTSCILMSPIAFIQKPIRWLQVISNYRATTSGGPNFAYDLLCRQVSDRQRSQLDLSSWEVAFSGAEPIRAETLDRFAAKFAPCGFRREAFYSCYGMAEATLFITGGEKTLPPRICHIDEGALEKDQAIVTKASHPRSRAIVSCGHTWLDGKLAIAHPETLAQCALGQIGEIWVSSSGLGNGYWNQPELTQHTFQARLKDLQNDTPDEPFLRTGDLGFINDGELFITGRLHDVLVFWGLNHYPDHIEQTVEACHSGFCANSGAAFAIPINGNNRLVVVQEVKRQDRNRIRAADVAEIIGWNVFDQHFIDVYSIVLVKPGGIPKTPSGKIQRRACRDKYLNGELEILDEWRSPHDAPHDISSMIRRYMNPMIHIKRYWATLRQHYRL
ncbi:MAG TPA: fatty acyl-AMP ligase [Elainellaceae cyanobacterium]